jgi:HEAT repeat protein
VWILTNIQRARKVNELLGQLSDPDQLKAMEAVDPLRHRPGLVGPRLLAHLSSPDEAVRWRAALLAAEIGYRKPDVTDRLIALMGDKSTDAQRAAIAACGRLKLTDAEGPLANVMMDARKNPNVRAMAAASLGMIGSPASVKALAGLLARHPPVLPKTTAKSAEATTATAAASTAATPAKTEAKPAAAAGAKPTATTATTTTAAAAPAAKVPEDKTWQLRMECALALGQIVSPDSAKPVAEAVRDDVEPKADVRVAAAYALGDLGRKLTDQRALETAVNGLIEAMGDEVGDVRVAAATCLAGVYPPKAMRTQVEQVLRDHMDDDHFWVREAVKATAHQLGISAGG